MSQTIDNAAFDRAADPLLKLLTLEQLRQIVEIAPDTKLIGRLEELAERSEEGELREVERAEYEGYVRANNLLTILQGIAQRRLIPGQTTQ